MQLLQGLLAVAPQAACQNRGRPGSKPEHAVQLSPGPTVQPGGCTGRCSTAAQERPQDAGAPAARDRHASRQGCTASARGRKRSKAQSSRYPVGALQAFMQNCRLTYALS